MPFTCPQCGKVSHNPNDVAQGYCGACHDWTGLDPEGDWFCGRCGGTFGPHFRPCYSFTGYGEVCLSCFTLEAIEAGKEPMHRD